MEVHVPIILSEFAVAFFRDERKTKDRDVEKFRFVLSVDVTLKDAENSMTVLLHNRIDRIRAGNRQVEVTRPFSIFEGIFCPEWYVSHQNNV